MKRLAINYSRKFPDHRLEADFLFNKQLMKGPSTYFRLTKDAYNATGAKYFHILLTCIGGVSLLIAGFAKYYGEDLRAVEFKKTAFPGFKYVLLTQRGGYGAYDNILNKFEGEEGGIMDVPFDE